MESKDDGIFSMSKRQWHGGHREDLRTSQMSMRTMSVMLSQRFDVVSRVQRNDIPGIAPLSEGLRSGKLKSRPEARAR